MKFNTRPATKWDIVYVSNRLRKADQREFTALTGLKPKALPSILKDQPNVMVWTVDGKPAAIFGCDPVAGTNNNVYAPWMMGTTAIEKHPAAFHRTAYRLIRGWADMTPLTNVVHADNTLHITWLKRLGAELKEYIPCFGVNRQPFWRFEINV